MSVVEPRARKWTKEEYRRMADLGLFRDQRVQLVEGEVLEMSPQRSAHATAVELARRGLERAFGESFHARMQLADSSLDHDRNEKASLHARAGIAECWIVDLVDRRLEVHLRPGADPTMPFDHGYAERGIFRSGETVRPEAAAPGAEVASPTSCPDRPHPMYLSIRMARRPATVRPRMAPPRAS